MLNDLLAFLSWYFAVTAAGLIALPLAFRLFHLLPDRGYTLARPLGLLTIGYVFWLLGSLGFLRNDAAGVWIAALLTLLAGALWLRREGWAELRDWLNAQRGLVLAVEVLFLLAFAAWAWVRAHNPDIAGTEKPMEFMFINAILRSPAFPPNDAWLSGYAISYYYFGYVLVAALIHVTGVASAVAFNLALALLFALAVTGALGITLNLIALSKTTVDGGRPTAADRRLSSAVLSQSFWPALLAPLMIVVAGNFYGVLRLAHANGLLAGAQVPALIYNTGAPELGGGSPGAQFGFFNLYTWLDLKGMNTPPASPGATFNWDPGFWWWFNGARVTHDRNLLGQETEAITEMPAFSFILGDLHPHVLGLPFVFLAIALALQWLLWAQRCESGDWRWMLRVQAAPLLLTALVLGGLAFLNTWDFPIYLFVVTLAFTLGLASVWDWQKLQAPWPMVAAFALALLVPGVALYLPFYVGFQTQAGGLLPNLIYPTRFQQTVVFFAHTLIGALLFLVWLAVRERAQFDGRAARWAGGGVVALLLLVAVTLSLVAALSPELSGFAAQFVAPLSLGEALALTVQRRLIDSFTTLVPALMIGLCAGLAVGAVRGRFSISNLQSSTLGSPTVLLCLVLLLTGALLLLGPEFVYLRDLFGTRMNTIFKFYFQAWVLWGVAGAFGLWLMAQHARPWVWRLSVSVMALSLGASLLYTIPATFSATRGFAGPPTLDGMAYFARNYPNDWAAIQWLNQNVPDAPTLAEGIGGQYWIEGRFSRISMATGLPTVIGWPGHQSQWRGRYFSNVAGREDEVRNLYQSRSWDEAALRTLDKYGIEYVVWSDLERQKYGRSGEAKFADLMRPVFQSGDLTLYQRLNGGP
jgi:YYY domain-containing protein